MVRVSRWLISAVVVLAVLAASASTLHAQTVCYQPVPVVAAPVTSYYAPVPVASYYAPVPVASYYAPAPVVTSYYAPATVATTYRYGLFGRRSVTTYSGYYSPAPVYYTPAPAVVRYGAPVVVYP
jgi:ABC-type multidrug transport system permease subunit